MKKRIFWILLPLVCTPALCLAEEASKTVSPDPLFRSHYLGARAGRDSTNGSTARAIAAMPSTTKLLDLALDRLAATPPRLWPEHLPKDANSQSALLRPLLSDLLTAESWTDCHRQSNQWICTVAVRLSPDQAQRWNTNLWQLLSAWQLGRPQTQDQASAAGWEIADPKRPFHFLLAQAKDWVVLGLGSHPNAQATAWLEQINASGQPATPSDGSWLDLEIDWPRLLRRAPLLGVTTLPRMRWTLTGDGEYVRNEGVLTFAKSLDISLDPWLIPTNLINDPIVTFTVARGIKPFLAEMKIVSSLLEPLPNQFCSWGQTLFHGQTLATAPYDNPPQQVTTIVERFPKTLDMLLRTNTPGEYYFLTNKYQFYWRRLPLITPFFTPIVDHDQKFLLAGLFPTFGRTNPPPQDLFAQLGNNNDLVYYDWEITEKRLLHMRHYYQMATILAKRKNISSNDLSYQWLEDIHTKLGNTTTAITQASPAQFKVVRRSHLGFTGVELVLLAEWIDSPGFPLTFEMPVRVLRRPDQVRKAPPPE